MNLQRTNREQNHRAQHGSKPNEECRAKVVALLLSNSSTHVSGSSQNNSNLINQLPQQSNQILRSHQSMQPRLSNFPQQQLHNHLSNRAQQSRSITSASSTSSISRTLSVGTSSSSASSSSNVSSSSSSSTTTPSSSSSSSSSTPPVTMISGYHHIEQSRMLNVIRPNLNMVGGNVIVVAAPNSSTVSTSTTNNASSSFNAARNIERLVVGGGGAGGGCGAGKLIMPSTIMPQYEMESNNGAAQKFTQISSARTTATAAIGQQDKPPSSAPNLVDGCCSNNGTGASSVNSSTSNTIELNSVSSAPVVLQSTDRDKARMYQECISFIPTIKAFLACTTNGSIKVSDMIIQKARALMHPFEKGMDISAITLQRVMAFIETSLIPVISYFRIPLQRIHQPLTQLQESYVMHLNQRTTAGANQQQSTTSEATPEAPIMNNPINLISTNTVSCPPVFTNNAKTPTTPNTKMNSIEKQQQNVEQQQVSIQSQLSAQSAIMNERLAENDRQTTSEDADNEHADCFSKFIEALDEIYERRGEETVNENIRKIREYFEKKNIRLVSYYRPPLVSIFSSPESSDNEESHSTGHNVFGSQRAPLLSSQITIDMRNVSELLQQEIDKVKVRWANNVKIRQLNEMVSPADSISFRIRIVPSTIDSFVPPFKAIMRLAPPDYKRFKAIFDIENLQNDNTFIRSKELLMSKAESLPNTNMSLCELIEHFVV